MKASELVNRLNALIKEHGDQNIIIIDSEYSDCCTVCDIDFVTPNNGYCDVCGFELDTCIANF